MPENEDERVSREAFERVKHDLVQQESKLAEATRALSEANQRFAILGELENRGIPAASQKAALVAPHFVDVNDPEAFKVKLEEIVTTAGWTAPAPPPVNEEGASTSSAPKSPPAPAIAAPSPASRAEQTPQGEAKTFGEWTQAHPGASPADYKRAMDAGQIAPHPLAQHSKTLAEKKRGPSS